MSLQLGEAVAQFLARYDNPQSARSYQQTLDYLLRELPHSKPLRAITREDIDRWEQTLRARDLADATLMSHRRKLKAFFNWAATRSYVRENVASHLQVRRRQLSIASKAIPSEVLSAMMSAVRTCREPLIGQRNTAILALMVTFGVRRGDVAKLTLKRVHLREGWIVFRTKGDHELRVPLPPETARVLAEWLDIRAKLQPARPHNYVFTTVRADENDRYRPLNVESISTMIKRLSAQVSGTTYGPHSIRHWFGQYQADQRIPPTILRDIMGHSDVTITLDFYYNQDYDRVRRVLYETELGKAMRQHEPGTSKPRILRVDFSA